LTLFIIQFQIGYCQIELSSELGINALKGNAEATIKQFQSLLNCIGSNHFNLDEKQSFILDGISSSFENEKVRIVNDIKPEGSADYSVDIYLRNISVWFPPPKEVSFSYTIESISDVFFSDDHSYLFIKVEANRKIDAIDNDNGKFNNLSKLDIYIKFNIVGGQIKRKARIYSITEHKADMAYEIIPIKKLIDEIPIQDATESSKAIEISETILPEKELYDNYNFIGWINAKHIKYTLEKSLVELEYINLYASIKGKEKLLKSFRYKNLEGEHLINYNKDGILLLNTSSDSENYWSVWTKGLTFLPKNTEKCRIEVKYRIIGPAEIQIGIDLGHHINYGKSATFRNRDSWYVKSLIQPFTSE